MPNPEDIFREIHIRLLRGAMEMYQDEIVGHWDDNGESNRGEMCVCGAVLVDFDDYQYCYCCGRTFSREGKKSIQRARELLKHFLEPEQWEEFEEHNYFTYKDSQNRNWKFIAREHYPIECREGYKHYRICIDSDPEAPVEDLLLQCYLEVKGGRGEELLPKYDGISEGNVEENAYRRVEPRAYRDDLSVLINTIFRFYPELRGYEIVRGRARVCYPIFSTSYNRPLEVAWEEVTIEEHTPVPGIKLYFGVSHRARILVVPANPQS